MPEILTQVGANGGNCQFLRQGNGLRNWFSLHSQLCLRIIVNVNMSFNAIVWCWISIDKVVAGGCILGIEVLNETVE